MNIILVDDEAATLQILKKVIPWEKLGIRQVYTAKNVQEAKTIFQEKEIDISLCDIEMPQESGLELIKWVQGLYPGVVNIILTGHADFNYARSAVSLGVYRFLLKPVAFEEVEQTILEVIEKLEDERLAPLRMVSESVNTKKSATEEVKSYLEMHYNEVITRNDIEQLVHLNRDHINREFKAETGYTLMEYIQYYRVCMAKKMLRDSDDSVSEIGLNVGYDSPAYFAKIFKKQTGETPMNYRSRHLKA